MKRHILLVVCLALVGCQSKGQEDKTSVASETKIINTDKNTIRERFSPPEGYQWVQENKGSYGDFLINFPLKKYDSPILDYTDNPIATQNLHEAVFDIDTGKKDLQQCADAVMRMRAEYLYKTKQFDKIGFHFTSGDYVTWNDYKNGKRAFVSGNRVNFKTVAKPDDSYENFRTYLDLIFNYAGTISLQKETKRVIRNEDIKTGDILITGGSPGHVVFVSGICENKEGKRLYLLSEGYTPAQSIHLLKNPFNKNSSPWYPLDVNSKETKTARYYFSPTDIRSF